MNLRISRVFGGLAVCLCAMGTISSAAAEEGVVRLNTPPATIAPAGYAAVNQQAMYYEMHRPSPYMGYSQAGSYSMPQRPHPVDRWYYVRRFFGMDQNKSPYPRYQYNYSHGATASRLTPMGRMFR